MSEDLEQKGAEAEVRHNRDQELATILAMDEEGRRKLAARCFQKKEELGEKETGRLGGNFVFAIDGENPMTHQVSGGMFGTHSDAINYIIKKRLEGGR
ncbi:MAG: hypothetical protein KGZ85_04310 [Ignavibacterium sp.]|nr:hypothetical protein [Ignavibacterium sp.]